MNWVGQLGLSAKMTMPFVLVLVGALGMVGTLAVQSTRASLTQSLETRAEIVGTMLAGGVADPLSLGEDEVLQQLLDRSKAADTDVAYALLVNPKGEVVAPPTRRSRVGLTFRESSRRPWPKSPQS